MSTEFFKLSTSSAAAVLLPKQSIIKIIGEDHRKDIAYREQLERLAKQGSIILIREGDNFGSNENNIYGIEDRIVNNYANIMFAYFKGLFSTAKIQYFDKCTNRNFSKQLYESFFHRGRNDIAYYIHAIGQLFLLRTQEEVIAGAIEQHKSIIGEQVFREFLPLFEEHQRGGVFNRGAYDINLNEVISNEFIEYFFVNKPRWDRFLYSVMRVLLEHINLQSQYNQLEALNTRRLERFIDICDQILALNMDTDDYQPRKDSLDLEISSIVNPIMNDARNSVFAENLLKIKKSVGNLEKEIYFLVGNEHINGLKKLLGEDGFEYYDKNNKPSLEKFSQLTCGK